MVPSKSGMRTFRDWIFIVLISLFSVYMFFLGINTRDEGKDMYEASISGRLKVKTMSPCIDCVKSANTQAITYFMLAIGGFLVMVLLPKIQSVSFAGASIVLQELEKKVDEIGVQGNALQEKIVNGATAMKDNIPPKPAGAEDKMNLQTKDNGGKPQVTVEDKALNDLSRQAAPNRAVTKNIWEDDPQKGKWGGFSSMNGRILSAEVSETSDPEFFRVLIKVSGDKDNPLTGLVRFHLHPTFIDPSPVISAANNIAELRLKKVWGAFTLGAEMDGGKTRLELDLAELEGVPKLFKSR